MRVGILITHIRAEEKLLISAFEERGIQPDIILDRDLNFDLTAGGDQLAPSGAPWSAYGVVMERAVSTSRGLYALALLNS
ncbi:MAG: lysine biosynthesis protein LysX, partial [Anaerolineae bacterium]|nr:lysine biosynthesis protein LysX [Anaerolineae bacterium]